MDKLLPSQKPIVPQPSNRPVGSGAAWRRSPHQKSAGRESEKRKRGRKEREKRRKKKGEKGKKGRGEQEKLREKDVLRLWV